MGDGRAVLLVGKASGALSVAPLLRSAGFTVDAVVSRRGRFTRLSGFDDLRFASNPREAVRMAARRARTYDWVQALDDEVLDVLRDDESIAVDDRVHMSPVPDAALLPLLHSKFAVSEHLRAHGIPTPDFTVVESQDAAIAAAERLGGDVIVKGDGGSSGSQVRRAQSPRAVRAAIDDLPGSRWQVQRFLAGRGWDLSAIYADGDLVHHTYSSILEDVGEYGPSSARRYLPASLAPHRAESAVREIGRSMRLTGFVNISAIQTPEGPQVFEVDPRPNIWASVGALVGDDPVIRLRAHAAGHRDPMTIRGPHSRPRNTLRLARARRRHLLTNAHGVWGDLSGGPNSWRAAATVLLKG